MSLKPSRKLADRFKVFLAQVFDGRGRRRRDGLVAAVPILGLN